MARFVMCDLRRVCRMWHEYDWGVRGEEKRVEELRLCNVAAKTFVADMDNIQSYHDHFQTSSILKHSTIWFAFA